MVIPAGSIIGTVQQAVVNEMEKQNDEEFLEMTDSSKASTTASEEELHLLQNLLKKWKHVFSRGLHDLGEGMLLSTPSS